MIYKWCVTCVCCEITLLLSLLFILDSEMPPARSSVNMPRDKTLVGIRCIGYDKHFKTSYSFDQHQRSNHMRGTACYALPEKTRSNLYAVKRHNMSTGRLLLHCRKPHSTAAEVVNQNDIFCIFCINYINYIF